ncbi:diacylglycerol kinase family protein [Naasia sp. SYSU D00948]|uniref:diacylglycerol/lipid kinase family protein n=1 Tax=Naasia sp. SYSU D00948 TaxID=2817379 RepID=UPI001B313946|nr:diacylglycerol kinase family protein [Naasia sp. SYSU D00948]
MDGSATDTAGSATGTADAGTRTKAAAVVYNPIKVDLPTLRASVDAAAAAAGWGESRWYETSEEDPGKGQTEQAVRDGADVVLAAGGDGTVRAVAEGLRDSGVPIALLPSGTGNLLARNLNLTLGNLDDAVATGFEGTDREIDLGVVEVRRPDGSRDRLVFLVMAGIGLDAQMIENTDTELKKKVGWLAYVDAIRKSLKGDNNTRLRFQLDGAPPRNLRVHTLMIGNCGSLPANILLLPEAAVDDGLFDIVALRPQGLFGWIQIWVKIVWENGVLRRSTVGRKLLNNLSREVRALSYLKGKEIILRPERPVVFELDGDTFGEAAALKAFVDPLALTVKIPQAEADRLPASERTEMGATAAEQAVLPPEVTAIDPADAVVPEEQIGTPVGVPPEEDPDAA